MKKYHRVISKNSDTYLKNCLFTFNLYPVSFSPLLLWISTENRTKLKEILILNDRLKWNTSLYIQNAIDFLLTLVLRDLYKWRANKKKLGEEDNAHLNVRSKGNKL